MPPPPQKERAADQAARVELSAPKRVRDVEYPIFFALLTDPPPAIAQHPYLVLLGAVLAGGTLVGIISRFWPTIAEKNQNAVAFSGSLMEDNQEWRKAYDDLFNKHTALNDAQIKLAQAHSYQQNRIKELVREREYFQRIEDAYLKLQVTHRQLLGATLEPDPLARFLSSPNELDCDTEEVEPAK